MPDQSAMPDGSSSFFQRLHKNLKDDDGKFPVYFGVGLIAFFLVVASLAPSIGRKLGLISITKQNQQSYAQSEPTSKGNSVPDEILLRFKPGADDKVKKKTLERYNLTEKEEIPHIGVKVIKVNPNARDHVIEALSHNPAIDFAEENYIAHPLDTIPNDPCFASPTLAGCPLQSTTGQWGVQKIRAPAAWGITEGSSSAIVAVVDTGVYASHPDLTGKILTGFNEVTGDANTTDDFAPTGHGTKVAGIIGSATNNIQGIAGISWQSPILPVKVCDASGNCTNDNVASGITYAVDQGAKIINISLGDDTGSSTMETAVNYAWIKGVVIVAASGNNGSNTSTNHVLYPAAYSSTYKNVIAVGATSQDDPFFGSDQRASWSSYGPALDLVAPGDNILTTGNTGSYVFDHGTSFSAPHVAGVTALVLSIKPSLTPDQVASILETSAVDINDTSHFGSGPGWDQYYGWGRVDAYNALVAAGNTLPPPDITPPTVSISSPTSGSTVSGSINVNVASSDNVGVTRVELYEDGSLFATDISSPYAFFLDTTTLSNSSHILVAKAYDAAGNIGTSTTVTVTVSNTTPTPTPTPTINPSFDSDGDGFPDVVENYVGTNPSLKCMPAQTLGIPSTAWPPDLNGDNKVTLADVLLFNPVMNSAKGDGKYNRRFDLNADGKISLADTLTFNPVFNTTCSL